MSHIFISYAHDDKSHLDKLVTWLQNNDFREQEIWYDEHIEGGNNWRDEIATALDDAYTMLVIVTTTSMKSLFCTYEWAYAMGQGMQVYPLVFENVNIDDVPTPLTSKQFISCTEDIPPHLKDQLRRLRSTPPQIAMLNRKIYNAIYDTHRRFFILGWLGGVINYLDEEYRDSAIDYFVRKASEAHQILQTLMLDKSFAFSGKQYRLCWELTNLLKEFSELSYKYDTYLQDRLFPQFYDVWLPAFEYFEEDGRWRKWTYKYFEWDLELDHVKMTVFAEMLRSFPTFDVSDVEELIHNKAIDQKREKEDSDKDSNQ